MIDFPPVLDSCGDRWLAVLKKLLESMGHEVEVASDGPDALVRFTSGRFDVILMDIHMPGMSGLEATKQIREGERGSGSHIPIIALTAAVMKEDQEHCLAAGMDDFVAKPIVIEELRQKLLKYAASAEPHQTTPLGQNMPEVGVL